MLVRHRLGYQQTSQELNTPILKLIFSYSFVRTLETNDAELRRMKVLRNTLLVLLTFFFTLSVQQFLFCPRFNFQEPTSFSGPNIYNPYAKADSLHWQKANLHAHSNAWHGFTNGNGTAEDIWKAYDSLGYAFHSVSEYHAIDKIHAGSPNYIPAYEHGYNVKKTHYQVLGDEKVTWLDYIMPQTLWNKQWLLNKLSQNPETLVVLNHPAIRSGFTTNDLQYLEGYRCMEVLNPAAQSFDHWDAALSAGKPVFVVGNDDIHNVFKTSSLGRFCTVVNVAEATKDNLFTALRTGNSYGMSLMKMENETLAQKAHRIGNAPQLISLQVVHDTISLQVSEIADEITFIGKNGSELSKTSGSSVASYTLAPGDEYVRAVVSYADGTSLYLNPVFRYSDMPFKVSETTINASATLLFRFLGVVLLTGWAYVIYLILPYRLTRRRMAYSGWDGNNFPSEAY